MSYVGLTHFGDEETKERMKFDANEVKSENVRHIYKHNG